MLFIIWDVDPVLAKLGSYELRYYSILFGLGFFFGYQIVRKLYIEESKPTEHLESLFVYIFIGTVVGARLGHCLFYEPSYYLSHPLEMLLPFSFDDGIRFTGFLGLASHGGILGVVIAIWLYCRKYKYNFFNISDKVVIGGSLTGGFIRLGNFMNSEILGKATNSDYGVIFKQVDEVVRHPAQLYESLSYFAVTLILWMVYRRRNEAKKGAGFVCGLFFVLLFVSRFIIEFYKINQVTFEDGMSFNMGQLLSIPFILMGLFVMWWKRN
jgi:prolipoprotein diacylglyceryl transferase